MKKGFIATSLIYSFFLLFCTVILAFVGLSIYNKNLLRKSAENIRVDLKNLKLEDVEGNPYVNFDLDLNGIVHDDDHWVVLSATKNETKNEVTLISLNVNYTVSKPSLTDTELANLKYRIDNSCIIDSFKFADSSDLTALKKVNKNISASENDLTKRLVIKLSGLMDIVGGSGDYSNPYTINGNCYPNEFLVNRIYDHKDDLNNVNSSYYYKGSEGGSADFNYLIFKDMCWRIVKVDRTGNVVAALYNQNSSCSNIVSNSAIIGNVKYSNTDYLEGGVTDSILKYDNSVVKERLINWGNSNLGNSTYDITILDNDDIKNTMVDNTTFLSNNSPSFWTKTEGKVDDYTDENAITYTTTLANVFYAYGLKSKIELTPTNMEYGIRPIITLDKSTKVSGVGTVNFPYVVKEENTNG